jgi:hypothetical protein
LHIFRKGEQAKVENEILKRVFSFNNQWLIMQLYYDKVIQDEFWNGIQVFIPQMEIQIKINCQY